MKKNNYVTYGIYVLFFIIYSLVVFLLFKNYNAVFWVSYGFMAVTFLTHILELTMYLKCKDNQKGFIGLGSVVATGLIVGAALVFSLIVMFGSKVLGLKTVILVHSIILAIQIVVALIGIVTKNSLETNAESRKKDVVFIKGIGVEIDMLINKCNDKKLKGSLLKLKEVVEYSDPISNAVVSEHEEYIIELMDAMKKAFAQRDNLQAKELCSKMEDAFTERNKILLSTK